VQTLFGSNDEPIMIANSNAFIIFLIVLASIPIILVGSFIGLIVGAMPGKSIVLSKGLAAMAGGMGSLIGAWLTFGVWWKYYALPILNERGEPGSGITYLIFGGLVGAWIMTLIVVFWTKKTTRPSS
jgi:hypothetical protein